ncbi:MULTISPECIES: metal-dependent transcriptional regulator [Microbacterium]|uniref:metal-dependent transcriptional regulator n=1 Tax=Microbacterium TaxID=33882 RepID=UPI00217CFCBC|nr:MULTISPECIES: metal-dependent transcriptional regulator [Microbacterium]UWF77402.1 metal-dependent transcriptional regulator [Microbacterium neungamense]WCM55564.1 metal-dependent transcriptional regulator [Microbacterium sp. EF45047]
MASPAADDYLKTVYSHTEWQDAPITPSQLAAQLGIAPSSVTEMVKKLAAAGLVSHVPYGAVRLTDAGERRALQMLRRHRLIETWLVREFGYAWDEVHDEAEVLEHTISDRLLEGIDERLGRPHFDPHGDAIPDASGRVQREPFVLLRDAGPGHTGRVLRVSDRDPELLRALENAGVGVGRAIVVADAGILLDGRPVELPAGAAEVVWLSA